MRRAGPMPDLFDSNIPIVLFPFRTESPTIDEALFGAGGKSRFLDYAGASAAADAPAALEMTMGNWSEGECGIARNREETIVGNDDGELNVANAYHKRSLDRIHDSH
jgi:hypothetical protein